MFVTMEYVIAKSLRIYRRQTSNDATSTTILGGGKRVPRIHRGRAKGGVVGKECIGGCGCRDQDRPQLYAMSLVSRLPSPLTSAAA